MGEHLSKGVDRIVGSSENFHCVLVYVRVYIVLFDQGMCGESV